MSTLSKGCNTYALLVCTKPLFLNECLASERCQFMPVASSTPEVTVITVIP